MRLQLLVSLVCLFVLPGVSSAGAPKSMAGIPLGANVKEFSDKIDLSTALPLWRSEYLAKVTLKPIEGFRSGYIVYGNCKNQGRIVRIKLSYEDESQEFYDRLHTELTKKFGKPKEWRGNPFGTLKIWKWSLKDAQHNSVSIIIERFEGDDDSFTPGNSIRLTDSTHMEEEKSCFKPKDKSNTPEQPARPTDKKDFSWYLPEE